MSVLDNGKPSTHNPTWMRDGVLQNHANLKELIWNKDSLNHNKVDTYNHRFCLAKMVEIAAA
jgi:acetylglutamate synthase